MRVHTPPTQPQSKQLPALIYLSTFLFAQVTRWQAGNSPPNQEEESAHCS